MPLDYSATYNGLSFGNGTNVQIIKAVGVHDLPPIRNSDHDRPRDQGQFAGTDLLSGRDVTIDLLIIGAGTSDFFTTVETVKTAVIVQGATTTQPLKLQVPGWNSNYRQLYCRPRKRDIAIDINYQYQYAQASMVFHAVDPRWYDINQQSVAIGAPAASTGMTFNLAFDLSFGGGATGGSAVLTNSGNFETRPVVTIAGPCSNPAIGILGGSTLTFNITLGSTDTLTIDTSARTVVLNGVSNRYSTIATGSQWWSLPPGSSTVQFVANSGSATIVFSSAWI